MISVMEKDNERNANLAPKILNDTIKACGGTTNAGGQQPRIPIPINEGVLDKVFTFLDSRIEFISTIGQQLKTTQYAKIPGDRNPNSFADPKGSSMASAFPARITPPCNNPQPRRMESDTFKMNSQSINFIGQIPHIYVHLMAYTDP